MCWSGSKSGELVEEIPGCVEVVESAQAGGDGGREGRVELGAGDLDQGDRVATAVVVAFALAACQDDGGGEQEEEMMTTMLLHLDGGDLTSFA